MKIRRKTNRVIFHHTLADVSPMSAITLWHKAKGWSDVGYHYLIRRDGTRETGRDKRLVGAHAYGSNGDSIGVALEGNFHEYEPSEQQLESCIRLYHQLCTAYSKQLKIGFHRPQWLWNSCPGNKLDRADFKEIVYRGWQR